VITIFVDIRGAFDNVWWPGLLSTLRDRHLPHEFLAIIKSYLTDRTVLFTQGDVTTQKRITKGCPQGSVLGPTLWNFLLDPLLNAEWPEGTKVVAYADDLAIIVAHDSRQTLKTLAQQALDLVTNWATENKLKLSTEKTVFMVHKSPPRVHQRDIRLLLYDALVKRVNNQRYLGLIIDPKFNFELNAAYATQRARSITLGLRRRAARHWGQSAPAALRTIYRGAILPILTYASPVWINKYLRATTHKQLCLGLDGRCRSPRWTAPNGPGDRPCQHTEGAETRPRLSVSGRTYHPRYVRLHSPRRSLPTTAR
jgi:hypothetical protein